MSISEGLVGKTSLVVARHFTERLSQWTPALVKGYLLPAFCDRTVLPRGEITGLPMALRWSFVFSLSLLGPGTS